MNVLDVVVFADGRDAYLDRAMESVATDLCGSVDCRWLVDDTGDEKYRRELAVRYPDFHQIGHGPRRGFGGSIAHAWAILLLNSDATHVAHYEQDFVLTRPVDTSAIMGVLADHDHLAQMALRRQPCNPAEHNAGGVVELTPDAFEDQSDFAGNQWLEHRRFFTTNPSIYPLTLTERGWPDVDQSEGMFSLDLFGSSPLVRCAYWGSRESGVWAEHIGTERAEDASGY